MFKKVKLALLYIAIWCVSVKCDLGTAKYNSEHIFRIFQDVFNAHAPILLVDVNL